MTASGAIHGMIKVKVGIKGIGDDAVRMTVSGSLCCHKPPFLKI
jgi:hypothetical protein